MTFNTSSIQFKVSIITNTQIIRVMSVKPSIRMTLFTGTCTRLAILIICHVIIIVILTYTGVANSCAMFERITKVAFRWQIIAFLTSVITWTTNEIGANLIISILTDANLQINNSECSRRTSCTFSTCSIISTIITRRRTLSTSQNSSNCIYC
ncbi:unnamed protein product [Paramecium octaurelia]|uniref:Uncharacterized protein n=1 Tax=Paramecium octaurelia TaxID=43137 RepID=A0A8S1TJC9_PAROT|nr:unnamed protein product [Paramecium octaurelia]